MKREVDNGDFVMVYRQGLDAISELAEKNGKAAALLSFMIRNMDKTNGLMVSSQCLSEIFKCSIQTIYRRVDVLKKGGYIKTLKSGTSNIYVINAGIAWTTHADKRQYATFNARVVISLSEQTKAKGKFVKQVAKK